MFFVGKYANRTHITKIDIEICTLFVCTCKHFIRNSIESNPLFRWGLSFLCCWTSYCRLNWVNTRGQLTKKATSHFNVLRKGSSRIICAQSVCMCVVFVHVCGVCAETDHLTHRLRQLPSNLINSSPLPASRDKTLFHTRTSGTPF